MELAEDDALRTASTLLDKERQKYIDNIKDDVFKEEMRDYVENVLECKNSN